MPRTDRLTLTAKGLTMPSVDHLSNKSSLNVLLDRALSGQLAGVPRDMTLIGLFTNFARLTDKALREYDAARAELLLYLEPSEGLRTSPYLRAIDHMENCIGAAHRAVLNATALRENGVGRGAPRLTALREERLRNVRHAVEHADEKLLGKQKYKKSPPFSKYEPYSLRLANTSLVIGNYYLNYRDLVTAMTKAHAAIEHIRGVPTGAPGPNFPNATLRTTHPGAAPPTPGTMRPSSYLKELSRLTVTH
jgi:hypothetical protein